MQSFKAKKQVSQAFRYENISHEITFNQEAKFLPNRKGSFCEINRPHVGNHKNSLLPETDLPAYLPLPFPNSFNGNSYAIYQDNIFLFFLIFQCLFPSARFSRILARKSMQSRARLSAHELNSGSQPLAPAPSRFIAWRCVPGNLHDAYTATKGTAFLTKILWARSWTRDYSGTHARRLDGVLSTGWS